MRRVDRRLVMAGLGLALFGCAPMARMAEGTRPPAEGGIGGTGIVGTLTGFGSLLVNGLRVATPPDMAVTDAFGMATPAELAPDRLISVEAADGPAGLIARHVHLTDPLTGRLEAGPRVNGVALEVPRGIALPAPGSRVTVSGLWRAGRVVVSRVAPASEGPEALAGTLTRGPWPGSLAIGGTPVSLPAGLTVPPLGTYLTLVGAYRAAGFFAARPGPERFTGAAGPLRRLSVEGYLDPVARAPGYEIAGLGHSFDEAARLGGLADARAVFSGPYTGAFEVAEALPLPEAPGPRRRLLLEVTEVPDRAGTVGTR